MNSILVTTDRLIIRSFTMDDVPAIHRIMELTFGDGSQVNDAIALQERRSWVEWQILNHAWFAKMFQPFYGDRAIELKATGTLIGSVGFVPVVGPFDQIPELRRLPSAGVAFIPEFALFWTIDPTHQGYGYATEAAQAMIAYAFEHLKLHRVLAFTDYTNLASQAVMRKAGMTITRNPSPEPPWLQIAGVIWHKITTDIRSS